MPQIIRSRRPELDQMSRCATEKGDICYVITSQIIIPMWRETPGWSTASTLRMMLVTKPDLAKLKGLVRGTPFNDEEILNQAAMAYYEFYRRVVANYEDYKAKKNTDVYAGLQFSKSSQMTKGE